MAKNIGKISELIGAQKVAELPDVGGGAFGAARLAQILHQRLAPSKGQRPGRPTDTSWVKRPKVPMSQETLEKLEKLSKQVSTGERQISPMQVAAQLLEDALSDV